jgi:hypothetical protein
LFEDGAVYGCPEETVEIVNRFIESPNDFARQSQAGRELVERKFSLGAYPQRMRELYANLELPTPSVLSGGAVSKGEGRLKFTPARDGQTSRSYSRIGARRRRVLFVAPNGIGLGHITRLMAIAERTSPNVEPIFITMSVGSSIVHARGHAADYIPSPRKIGVSEESWNRVFAQELLTAIEAFDIAAVIFDVNYPFPGLISVLDARPDIAWVWVRRGMWAPHHMTYSVMQAGVDMVIEPGEFAYDEDRGTTATLRDGVIAVPPILLTDHHARFPREKAAAVLGVDPGRTTAMIQLGSERNFDFSELKGRIVAALLERDVQVVEALNPLALPSEALHTGTLRKKIYPIAEYLGAIDLMVANAGYNSFHECIRSGVPAIFVPNEAPELDDQHVRATYAQSSGLGLCLRTSDLSRVADTIELALSEAFRIEHRRRSDRLQFQNGASVAAEAIEELLFSVRTDRPLNAAIARV